MNNMVIHANAVVKPTNANLFMKPENLIDVRINHANPVATTVKPTTANRCKTSRKLIHNETHAAFAFTSSMKHIGLINAEAKPACRLCHKKFMSMKQMYYHVRSHSKSDWKTYFACAPNIHNVKEGAVDQVKVDMDLQNAPETPALDHQCFSHVDEGLQEGADDLLYMAESSLKVEERVNSTGDGVRDFDLNDAPPMEYDN